MRSHLYQEQRLASLCGFHSRRLDQAAPVTASSIASEAVLSVVSEGPLIALDSMLAPSGPSPMIASIVY